jgi:ketosteroid isomerase-like protein
MAEKHFAQNVFSMGNLVTLEERNKKLVQEFFGLLNRGDVAGIVAAYAVDGRLQTMGRTLISGQFTRAQIEAAAGQIYQAFPQGLTFAIDAMTAEGERVAVEAHSRGRHASGVIYSNEYHFLFVFREGRLELLREYMDTERVTDILCGGQRPAAAATT